MNGSNEGMRQWQEDLGRAREGNIGHRWRGGADGPSRRGLRDGGSHCTGMVNEPCQQCCDQFQNLQSNVSGDVNKSAWTLRLLTHGVYSVQMFML